MLQNHASDARIRTALKNAIYKGKLNVVAALIGFPGGVGRLKEIAVDGSVISVMERTILSCHLN